MKLLLLLSVIFLITISAQNCNNAKTNAKSGEMSKDSASVVVKDPLYKAILETKAICMNYTLRLTEGKIDTSLIVSKWTDETTGKSYQNVFALGNPCTFPATIEQGQEFYFLIDTSTQQKQCAVCMAYYPVPPKKLFIKVIEK